MAAPAPAAAAAARGVVTRAAAAAGGAVAGVKRRPDRSAAIAGTKAAAARRAAHHAHMRELAALSHTPAAARHRAANVIYKLGRRCAAVIDRNGAPAPPTAPTIVTAEQSANVVRLVVSLVKAGETEAHVTGAVRAAFGFSKKTALKILRAFHEKGELYTFTPGCTRRLPVATATTAATPGAAAVAPAAPPPRS